MTKIRSIAERLRSDNANERLIAIRKIEQSAGSQIAVLIASGIIAKGMAPDDGRLLNILKDRSKDEVIIAMTSALLKTQFTWGDIIEAGILRISKTDSSSDTEEFDAVLKAYKYHKNFRKTQKHADNPAKEGNSSGNGKYSTNFIRTVAEDLPSKAKGIPYVSMISHTDQNTPFAIIRFHRMIAFDGTTIAPMCDFLALGKDWVDFIRKAESFKKDITVVFGKDRTPGRPVVIKSAV